MSASDLQGRGEHSDLDGGTGTSGLAGPTAPSRNKTTKPVMMFSVVALALLMSSLDQTIVATALHTLQHKLHTSINWASWTITIYSVGLILMLSVAGKLSDRYGRRRVFLASVAVFAGASLCCSLANDIYSLIALRALQAVGGAGFTPSATGIVVDYFGEARDRAVGLFGSIFPIGAMIGPVFGGLFVTYWSWRGIFLVNVPIGILLAVSCLKYVPRDRPRAIPRRARMDVRGMVLLGVGALTGMIGISYLGEGHSAMTSPWFVGPVLVALLALTLFGLHINHTSDPFISPRLIHGHGFGAVNVINLLYGGAVTGLMALVPLYATNRYGIAVLGSGTILTAEGVAVIALSSTAAFTLRRTGYRQPLYTGFLVVAVGMFMISAKPVGMTAYLWLAVAACLVGIGGGWSAPASRNACLQLAPEQSAALAALRSTGRQVGQITSISIASAVIAQASNPGLTQSRIFALFGLLLLVGLPIVSRIPEHHGAW